MEKTKVTVIVEEHMPGSFVVRRVKNRTEPLVDGLVTGVTVMRGLLDDLIAQGIEVIIDPPGYKRRWTP